MTHTTITAIHSIWIAHYGTHACSVWVVASSRTGWKVGCAFDGRFCVVAEPNLQVEAERYIQDAARADGMLAIECKDRLLNLLAHHALNSPWVKLNEDGK